MFINFWCIRITYHSSYNYHTDVYCGKCKETFFPVEYGEPCPACGFPNYDVLHDIIGETIIAARLHRDVGIHGETGFILPAVYLTHGLADRYIIMGLFALNSYENGLNPGDFAKKILSEVQWEKQQFENHMVKFLMAVLNRREEIEPFERRPGFELMQSRG